MIENIRLSFQGIFSHKIRSFLTMLGIIIGIAAIIAIVSTIKGTNEQIKNNLIGAGNNTVKVQLLNGEWPVDFSYESAPYGYGELPVAVRDEIEALKEVESCSMYKQRSYYDSVWFNDTQLTGGSIYGIDEKYFDINDYAVYKGKGFSKKDYSSAEKIVIIDDVIEKTLFGSENPIGQILDIGGQPFTVVGVVKKTTTFEPVINSMEDYYTYMTDQSGTVFLPISTWPIIFKFDEPQNFIAKAINTDNMTDAGKKTADILNGYASNSDTDAQSTSVIKYKSESLLEQAKSLQELSSSTNSMLIWIASISLLVGGIGVMNIMLVSVTERTREIGLKKALGARKHRILLQFLTEASVLTSIGGIIGVIFGIGLSEIIAKTAEVPVAISSTSIVVSVVFSMVVGIVFGLIPSIKAAKLNPIDALRYE